MRHRKKTVKLNRTQAHRRALFANLVSSLIREEKIVTTLSKARAAQPVADKMVTLGKKGTLAARRQALSVLRNKAAVKKLFDEISPRFSERNGGYTRVLKFARPRRGDGTVMAQLTFAEEEGAGSAQEKKAGKSKS